MAVVDATGAFSILVGIEPEKQADDFPPFGTFRNRI
jgi:hypothetical protein